MKIYVDTNILSVLVGLEIKSEDALALEKLALSNHEFYTSKLTEYEMKKCRNPKVKGSILFIYKIFGGNKFFNKETYLATGFGDAPLGTVPWGGGEVESPVLSILKQVLKEQDARHIFQALSSNMDYFLTLDEKTILKRYRQNINGIKNLCNNGNIKIVNPIELIDELKINYKKSPILPSHRKNGFLPSFSKRVAHLQQSGEI